MFFIVFSRTIFSFFRSVLKKSPLGRLLMRLIYRLNVYLKTLFLAYVKEHINILSYEISILLVI